MPSRKPVPSALTAASLAAQMPAARSASCRPRAQKPIGRRFGMSLFERLGRRFPKHFGPGHVALARRLFSRWGVWAVFFGRFVALLRIFAGDRLKMIMEKLKMPEGEAIEHPLVSRSLESAQRKVEGRNFDIRKQLLEYDDVANDQRKVIYQQRNDILDTPDVSDMVANMRQAALGALFDLYLPPGSIEEQWDAAGLEKALEAEYQLQAPLSEWMKAAPDAELDTLREQLIALGEAHYQAKVDLAGETTMRQFEHAVLLQHLDQHWREHLAALDHLRQGIHLRGYAQKNPKQEYKREAFELFSHMLDSIKRDVAQLLFTVRIQSAEEVAAMEAEEQRQRPMQFQHADFDAALAADVEALASASLPGDDNPFSPEALAAQGLRVGRNDPCPCGSGKKYKQCHGKLG